MNYYSFGLNYRLDLITCLNLDCPLFSMLSFMFFSLENFTFATAKSTCLENAVKQKNFASVCPKETELFFLTDGKSDQICMKGRDIERDNIHRK